MRAQAFEKLLERIEKHWEALPFSDDVCFSDDWGNNMDALIQKSRILRSRQNDASVIRELMNGNG